MLTVVNESNGLITTVVLFPKVPYRMVKTAGCLSQKVGENISYRPDDCGKLEEWQRLIELMCSARRGFKRKSSSVGISRQSVCRARYLAVSVPMTCMVTAPRILRTNQRLSQTGSSESIPITLARYWQ